jgi:hypothetical protein
MEQMVITIETNGKVGAMHNDAFNLSFLGKRTIKRASDITHNQATDKWDIYLNDGHGRFTVTAPALSGFNDYEEARKFEVKWLNECRLKGQTGGTSFEAQFVIAPRLRGYSVRQLPMLA